jgi:hypothetical protein
LHVIDCAEWIVRHVFMIAVNCSHLPESVCQPGLVQ